MPRRPLPERNYPCPDTHERQLPSGSGFIYDAVGNLTVSGTANYAYNGDELMKSEDTGGVTVTYSYDGDGQRIEKSNGTIYWYGLGGQVLDETNLSGSLTNEYVFFDGKRIARRDSSNNIFYYFADDLGTSREIVQSGQTTACYDADFYPYGGEILPDYANSCATSQNYKFTGKERDPESGLDDFGARYYSSSFGRFVSADWAAKATAVPYAEFGDPQSLNLYTYVRNNPITKIDPDGHCDGDQCSSIKVAVTVTDEPQMMQDVQIDKDKYFSGVGGFLSIKFTDKGNPIKGMAVKESNKTNGSKKAENPNSRTTDDKGTIPDLVGKGYTEAQPNTTSKDMAEGKQMLTTNPVNSTSTQTLTFTVPASNGQPGTCQATYSRTLTNTDSNGNLSTQNNSHGVNFKLTTTQPVVKPAKDQQQ